MWHKSATAGAPLCSSHETSPSQPSPEVLEGEEGHNAGIRSYSPGMPTETQETTITEKAVREEIRDVARDLEALRFRLLGVRASLPAPVAETREEDAVADMRAILDCVLTDSLEPALRDLRKLADDPGGG